MAQTLFDDARKLMTQEKYDEACPKFAESNRLDPAIGTLSNLALCHQKQGKTATAWAEYIEVRDRAIAKKDATRERFARQRLTELEPLLIHIRFEVPAASRVDGLELKLDGVVIGSAAWGESAPIDPGDHDVSASAPGHKPWNNRIAAQPGQNLSIPIPKLDAIEAPAASVASSSSFLPPTPPPSTPPTLAYVIGGLGVACLATGIGFGVHALSRWSDSNDNCPADRCSPQGAEASTDAVRSAHIADITIGLGLVGIGVSAYMLLSHSPGQSTSKAQGASIRVMGLQGGGWMGWGGSW